MTRDKITIRPTTGVYSTYKRLSYQPWTAIAEFVDNSTHSFFEHQDELKMLTGFGKLRIAITYEARSDGNDSLTITDNAFGMELDNFERAFQLDKPPRNTSGRSEFGMGLKTAACWFGGKWSVCSTQLGSNVGYSATIDVDMLAKHKDDEVDLTIFESTPEEHYTIIRIENLNKKITSARTIGKVKEFLSSIYRQDIRSGEISITYGESELGYKEPTILKEAMHSGETRVWKKEVTFSIPHDGAELSCHGFIALRDPGSLRDAGFTLMRRGRVIVGGPEKNYRPKEIFGDPNSFAYQRLFGELHMDNWPVTQAKDDFDWHTSGLEEYFIETLLPLCKEYKQKADTYRARKQAETNNVVDQVVTDFERAGVISDANAIPIDEPQLVSPNQESFGFEQEHHEEQALSIDGGISSLGDTTVRIVGPENYKMHFCYKGKGYLFEIQFDSSNALGSWVNVVRKDLVNYQIVINLKHAFFKPFTENKDFFAIMTKLVISMVLAEIDSLMISHDGRIDAGDVRRNMNSILEQIVSGGIVR